MNSFNLFFRPHSIACVDDDAAFVELLGMALPADWQLNLFTQTHHMMDFLNRQALLTQHDLTLFKMSLDESQNNDNSITRVLQYWKQNPQRWSLAALAVLDYSMPKLTGLQLLSELNNWQGLSVLLTGVADESVAVEAFNDGLIQRYIPKQSSEVVESLVAGITQLRPKLFKAYQQVCEIYLSPDQLMLLRKVEVQEFLADFAAEHWIEYVVIGKPFGALGLNAQGQVSWLQIERACDVEDLKFIASTEQWDEMSLKHILDGTMLPNSLLRQALASKIPPSLAPVLQIGDSGLIASHFKFEAPENCLSTISYSAWAKENLRR